MYPHRVFEVRRFTFPADKPIELIVAGNARAPMPTEERNVLTTSTGDILAILEGSSHLRGIYTSQVCGRRRVKINMVSGAIDIMTSEEIKQTPLGSRNPISKNFRILDVNEIPSHH